MTAPLALLVETRDCVPDAEAPVPVVMPAGLSRRILLDINVQRDGEAQEGRLEVRRPPVIDFKTTVNLVKVEAWILSLALVLVHEQQANRRRVVGHGFLCCLHDIAEPVLDILQGLGIIDLGIRAFGSR